MPATVPFVALDRQHASLRGELLSAWERVLDDNGFILGPDVQGFEEEFARFCGVRHCVGVGSGTAALTLALTAAGIGQGDEVIVPAHTYIASALGVVHAGATPVFCDVDEGTGLIDPDAADTVASQRTAAILPVHLHGQVCDMEALNGLARRRGLAVIEDAAQAHGARYRDGRAGSFGTAAAFSFYPSKNLGALGDGGAICTNDDAIADRARMLRHLGQRRKGEHDIAGYNERLDGVQAAVLRVKLPHLDGWNEARARHAAAYRQALPSDLRLVKEDEDSPSVHHLFPVRFDDRDALAGTLAKRGVQTGIHYSPSVPDQPPFVRPAPVEAFPVARAWAAQELSLPMFEHLRNEEIEQVASACRDALAEIGAHAGIRG